MRLRIKTVFALLLTVAAVSAGTAVAQNAIPSAAASSTRQRAELALGYSYLHSNAPPGGCGCFNLNGGNATFAWAVKPDWDVVGDVAVGYAGGISSPGYSLTLSTFTAGVRYRPPVGHSSFRPFGQILAGVAHSSGSLVQSPNPGATNAGAAFAANFGGGLDLRLDPRFSLRLAEADYLLTTFDNGTNDHQNNLRISAGVVIHF